MIRAMRQLMQFTEGYLWHEAFKLLSFGVPLVLLAVGLLAWAGMR